MAKKEDVKVVLVSKDHVKFPVSIQIAEQSVTLKDMFSFLDPSTSNHAEVPLNTISSPVLRKVLEWADHHINDNTENEKSEMLVDDGLKDKRTDDISPWDTQFLKVDQGLLFEMVLAANYLDIKGLLDLTCKAIANMIKGKTPEEIRRHFNIPNDFSQEELEQVRKENDWCEDQYN